MGSAPIFRHFFSRLHDITQTRIQTFVSDTGWNQLREHGVLQRQFWRYIEAEFTEHMIHEFYQVSITYSILTPRYRVLPEQPPGLQLVKKFPAFHGTRRFITALTSVRQLSLSWTSPIQSTYPHPTSWRSIHPSTPRSPYWSPSLRFPHQDPIHPHLLTYTLTFFLKPGDYFTYHQI